jgi:hypothetical protein
MTTRRLREGESLERHIKILSDIRQQLTDANHPIADNIFHTILNLSLPHSISSHHHLPSTSHYYPNATIRKSEENEKEFGLSGGVENGDRRKVMGERNEMERRQRCRKCRRKNHTTSEHKYPAGHSAKPTDIPDHKVEYHHHITSLRKSEEFAYTAAIAKPKPIDIELAHRRLGHLNQHRMLLLGNNTTGLTVDQSKLLNCQHCVSGIDIRKHLPDSTSKHRILALVYADIIGPIKPLTLGGNQYSLELNDHHSQMHWRYLMPNRQITVGFFQQWRKMVESETGNRVLTLRTDNGTEYTCHGFEKALKLETISIDTSPHRRIGFIEKYHSNVFKRTVATLKANNLVKSLWGEISATIVYLTNRSPSPKLNDRTPFELYYGKRPSLRLLLSLGCDVMTYSSRNSLAGQLHARKIRGKLVGYSHGSKHYKIWTGRRIIWSTDVSFQEDISPPDHVTIDTSINPPSKPPPIPSESHSPIPEPLPLPYPLPPLTSLGNTGQPQLPQPRRSGRNIGDKPADLYKENFRSSQAKLERQASKFRPTIVTRK